MRNQLPDGILDSLEEAFDLYAGNHGFSPSPLGCDSDSDSPVDFKDWIQASQFKP